MTQENSLRVTPNRKLSYIKSMLLGATVGLVLISVYMLGVKPSLEWGKYWMIRPLVLTPIAGAMGGLFYYFMRYLSAIGFINRILAVIIGLLGVAVALWLGFILGLDGTLWD